MNSFRKAKCPYLISFGSHLFTSSEKVGDGPRYETCSWCGKRGEVVTDAT